MEENKLLEKTKDYFDNAHAQIFYSEIYGGENLNVGIYGKEISTVEEAGRNTVFKILRFVPKLKKGTKVLLLGAGFGGAARLLAEKYGCKVECLNLSESQAAICEKKNKKAGLDELIKVQVGEFEHLPYNRETFDAVLSVDSMMYCENKKSAFREVNRVLTPGGRFIFTDIMQSRKCPSKELKKMLAPLELEELTTLMQYQRLANRADLERVYSDEMPEHLIRHFANILKATVKKATKISKKTSDKFINEKITEMQNWLDAAEKGWLNWGILQFQKRNK